VGENARESSSAAAGRRSSLDVWISYPSVGDDRGRQTGTDGGEKDEGSQRVVMTTPYWIVSLPLNGSSADESWATLQRHTGGSQDLAVNYRLACPELRVGTLDSLLALSDDLVKVNALAEQVVEKVRRQYGELGEATGTSASTAAPREGLLVEGEMPERFLTTFEWDEARNPARRALKETVEKLTERTTRMDEEFKLKCGQLSTSKNHLSAVVRKTGGATNVDLEAIDQEDIVQTENLTTLIVSVPKMRSQDWVDSYETLSNFVVPRSSKVVHTEGDNEIRTVVLFRRVVDAFITAAREKLGCSAKEYNHDPEAALVAKSQRSALEREVAERRESLMEWCQMSYGEIFSTWMHLSIIRIFVESILRYGLPPDFQVVVMRPNLKHAVKLRKVLNQEFGDAGSSHWDDATGADERTATEDMYSYVSLTMKI